MKKDILAQNHHEIKRLVESHISLAQIAKQFACSPQTVREYCKASGIVHNPTGGWRIGSVLDGKEAELRTLMVNGATLEQAGAHFGVNYGTIRQFCLTRGIEWTRKRGWRHGSHTGEDHHSWKGGRYQSPDGYVWVVCREHPHANRDGCVREHRLVMEKMIGRYLERGEVVHHKDRNKSNNAQRTFNSLRAMPSI